MTRKDYVLIASAVNEYLSLCVKLGEESTEDAKMNIPMLHAIARELKKDNPAFDFEKFMTACLPTELL